MLISYYCTLVSRKNCKTTIKCTYFDWDDSVENMINRLEMLKGQNLLGSWESRFTENFKPSEQRFLGIQLFQKTRRTNHSLVPTTREFTAIRFEIIESLINFLKERYTLTLVG